MTHPPALDPKKIAVLVPNYIGGGAEKITDTLCGPMMRGHGYKVNLITLEMNEHTRPRAAAMGYEITDISAYGPDIISPEASDAILNALKNSGAKHIIYVGAAPRQIERYRRELPGRNIVYHLHTMPLWEPVVRILGTRRFVTAYGPTARIIDWYFSKYLKEKLLGVYTRRQAKQYRKIHSNVDHIIVLTESYRKELNRILGFKADSKQSGVTAIYNPFDPSDLEHLASSEKQKEILYLGRFHCIEKGVDTLLRAWKYISHNHPDWKLKLVGEGQDKCYLEYLINALDIPRVEFHNYSPNVGEHLSTASILCLPSNIEGWGMVMMEAMAAGVVPVASDCSNGVRELLADGRGELVQPRNYKALGRKLSYLLSNPRELESKRALYPEFIHSFSASKSVEAFHHLISQS